jgi:purine catabolism regulator
VITIAELEGLDPLDLTIVAGRSGASRSIRWVASSELADPTVWLRGGELLLTTGLGPGAAPSLAAYVDRLADAGLAGLGYAVGIHRQDVPAGLVAAAEKRGFPVIRVPYATSFVAITEAVMTRIVNEQYAQLERAMTLHDALVRLVIEDAGLEAIIAATEEATGGVVALVPRGDAALPGADDPNVVALDVGLSEPGAMVLVARLPRPVRDWDRAQLQQARTVVALELAKRVAVEETERRITGDLVDDLVAGAVDEGAARRRLRPFGIDDATGVAVVVARPRAPGAARALLAIVARSIGAGAIAGIRHGEVCIVLGARTDEEAVLRATEIHAAIGSTGQAPRVGVSRFHARVRDAREAYEEAWYALEARVGSGRDDGTLATSRDLGSVGLLLSLQDERGLVLFVEAALGPLAVPTRRSHELLGETLAAFIACNGHLSAAADQLGAHRHTLRHRLRRIEALTGRTLDDAGDRLDLWLALRARGVLERRAALREVQG